jgi:two-component system chemotaxis sensor kinase CheA
LGKPDVRFVVEGDAIVLPPSQFNHGFWAALVHVVRNAVDHGVECPDERLASGKSPSAEIRLCAEFGGDCLTVSVSDDGRGIQWEALRRRAQSLGLPSETEDELVELLFRDGVSTAENVSDISGRGLGMAALRDEVRRSNGRVIVESTLGEGTRFVFELPVEQAHAMSVAS